MAVRITLGLIFETRLRAVKMGRIVSGLYLACLLLFVVSKVEGTLTPSGTVSLDCGYQQAFICSVTGVAAGWNITGLSGITAVAITGLLAANNNARITTTDTSGITQTSTITITGFTTSDNGGNVQCINLADGAVQGMATVSVRLPSCPAILTSTRNADFTAANVVWSQPPNSPPVTSATVTYCPTSSPNCGNSMTCTSPCTISGLDPCVNYSVTVTPNNNCGRATGCTMNMVDSPSQGLPSCPAILTLTRNTDFTAADVVWSQPPNSPPVTSTVVTYCPKLSPNCGNSVTCTGPCTISGLDPCMNYSVTVTPSNNCGFATGCTMNMVDSPSQGVPACPRDINVVEGDLCDSVNVTWMSSPSQTSATITYCQVSPQGSCMSVVCSSSPCTIQGVRRDREYEYTVLPTYNCGSPLGCTENTFTFALAECNVCTTSAASIIPTALAAVVPSVVLILFYIISVVVVFFLTRHCYKNTSKTSSPVKREDVYDQVQGGKTYEHITMTDSPAYGPVK